MTTPVTRQPTALACPVCGYSREYKTRALGAAHFPKHSCANELERIARGQRAAAARTREGAKRDCACKVARHEHGTRTAYVVDKCRCRACMDANMAASKEREKAKLYGRYDSGRVDAGPVREHIAFLGESGVSLKQLAKLTGLSLSTVSATVYGRVERGHGPYPRVAVGTAEKILAIRPDLEAMAGGRIIDGTGTQRRLQALVTIGWSMSRLAARLGINPGNFTAMVHGTRDVTAARAREVIALYDELWNKPQTGTDHRSRISVNRARRTAAQKGWVAPLAWDDSTIDDPAARPATGEPTTAAEARIADIEFMISTGTPWWEIAHRLRLTEGTLETFCRRAGRNDLITAAKTDTRDYRRAS